MKNQLLALALVLLAGMVRADTPGQGGSDRFAFAVLADTTYSIDGDRPLYLGLIEAINRSDVRFSIHLGDTKGYGDCGRVFQQSQRDYFDTFTQAVVYTPGNNEFLDCWKENRGSHNPVDIIAMMRTVFWAEPRSMGRHPLPLVRQSDEMPAHGEFAENARWTQGGVTFATFNMGGGNNQDTRNEATWKEFVRRDAANVAWMHATFAAARATGHRAVVIAFHANPWDEGQRHPMGPFEEVIQALVAEADRFDGQVLVVQGDGHEFTLDRPLTELDLDTPAVKHGNILRLQTYGWPDMKAVRISVDVTTPWVFGFEPLYAAGSVSASRVR